MSQFEGGHLQIFSIKAIKENFSVNNNLDLVIFLKTGIRLYVSLEPNTLNLNIVYIRYPFLITPS